MAYVLPTAALFKLRFPAFAAVDSALIDMVIGEASGFVDTSWRETDYQPAIMYLTAHMLTVQGVLTPELMGATSGPIKSESLGDASVSYGSGGGTSSSDYSGWSTTSYGRQFQTLLRVNNPPVLLVR